MKHRIISLLWAITHCLEKVIAPQPHTHPELQSMVTMGQGIDHMDILTLTKLTTFFTPVVRILGIKDDFCAPLCIRGSVQNIIWMLRAQ